MCLPGANFVGRKNRGNRGNVCQVQGLSADKIEEMQEMSVRFKLCRQTKSRKCRKCLPGSRFVGRQNRGNRGNVCQAQGLPADKTEEKPNMSARFKLCRQTKSRKYSKCLPDARFVGRQNRGNAGNVCQTQGLSADKTEEKPNMSARRKVSSADKIEEIQEMSAGFKVCRQTNTRKT